MPRPEAKKKFPLPEFYGPFHKLNDGTADSACELHARAILAVNGTIRRPPGQYLVVAHGGILNAAMRAIVGSPPPVNGKQGVFFRFKDLSYAVTRYSPQEHKWTIVEFHP
jgi:2,3-bisphosphoglycerate-dependent phosphoglycerate mutase